MCHSVIWSPLSLTLDGVILSRAAFCVLLPESHWSWNFPLSDLAATAFPSDALHFSSSWLCISRHLSNIHRLCAKMTSGQWALRSWPQWVGLPATERPKKHLVWGHLCSHHSVVKNKINIGHRHERKGKEAHFSKLNSNWQLYVISTEGWLQEQTGQRTFTHWDFIPMFLPAHCLYLLYTLQSRRDHQFNECSVEGRGEREKESRKKGNIRHSGLLGTRYIPSFHGRQESGCWNTIKRQAFQPLGWNTVDS